MMNGITKNERKFLLTQIFNGCHTTTLLQCYVINLISVIEYGKEMYEKYAFEKIGKIEFNKKY
jgi:hypothetical protein